jgi:hypothetical protein
MPPHLQGSAKQLGSHGLNISQQRVVAIFEGWTGYDPLELGESLNAGGTMTPPNPNDFVVPIGASKLPYICSVEEIPTESLSRRPWRLL